MTVVTGPAHWGGRLLRLAGWLVALAAVAWLARVAQLQSAALRDWRPPPGAMVIGAVLVIAYGALTLLIAEAWHRLVASLDGRSLTRRLTIPSQAVTQLGKYLPGNVMHYVGRHLWLARAGVAPATIVAAFAWEIVLLGGAALTAAGLALLLQPALAMPAGLPRVVAALPLLLCAVALGTIGCVRARWPDLAVPPAGIAFAAGAISLLFFAGLGGVLAAVTGVVHGAPVLALALAAAPLAWLAGFVTPGAPAGLGTREAVLVASLAPAIGARDALLAALLLRLVTTVGDLVGFGFGWLIAGQLRAPPIADA